jgi:hypothetical protein
MSTSTDQNLVHATKPQLLVFVQSIIGHPIDVYAIVAVLETYGLRDVDARERFGASDVFALADELYIEARVKAKRYPHIAAAEAAPHSRIGQFAVQYAKGLLSNAPWALQIASLLIFGYAFGVYTKFDGTAVTVAGVGMMLSFLVSGGFVQALGRMASFYNGQFSYALTRQAYYRMWLIGVGAILLSALVLDGVNWFVPLFPEESLAIGLMYYVCCGMMSLSLTLFYTLDKHIGLFFSTLAGVVVMVLVMEFTPFTIYVAHWTGFLVTSAVGFIWLHTLLKKLTVRMSKQQRAVGLPRFAALAPSVLPYFCSGSLYFAFLLVDRLMSWSVVPPGVHLTLWIHAGYEMLIIWGFAAFSLMLPLLEYIGRDFVQLIQRTQTRFGAGTAERDAHNNVFFDRYMQYWLMVAAMGIATGLMTYGVYELTRDQNYTLPALVAASPLLARQVLICGIVGYTLLVWGLMNTIMLNTLSRPWDSVRAYLWAIAVNVALGYWLSRSFGYWYSIVGLALGALVFAALTTRSVVRTLRQMDYSYYAS